jgi:uncharacterized protein (TIGR00645 family)
MGQKIETEEQIGKPNKRKEFVEKIIFNIKWLLIPAYLNLAWFLSKLLFNFIAFQHVTNEILMESLEAVDIVMIANLLVMIITGSYTSFISKIHNGEIEKTSSGLLKVKMSTSILGVTTIHLLKTFIECSNKVAPDWDLIYKQSFIHAIFIVGCLALAVIDYLHGKNDKH